MSNHRTRILSVFLLFGAVLPSSVAAQSPTKVAANAAKYSPKSGANARPAKPLTPVQKALAAAIAVVDMEAAAAHTKAYKSGQKNLVELNKGFSAKLRVLKTEIDNVKLELDILRPGTMKYVEAVLKHDSLVGKSKLASEIYNRELERRRAKNDSAIYAELTKAVGALAAERGIVLVLRKRPALSVEDMLKQKMVRTEAKGMARQSENNRLRSVIYHKKELDLTEDLIKYLKE